jgi:hypothetical protein
VKIKRMSFVMEYVGEVHLIYHITNKVHVRLTLLKSYLVTYIT